jgi:poly-beta-1,6-N-acetyl-D-glucosamine biosynthesis protein PgaD
VLTLGLWAIYFWLTSDVFIFSWRAFNWLFRGAAEPQQLARVLALFGTLGSYAGVVAFNAVTLLGWAIYNQYRFRGRERRKSAPHVSSADLSGLYGFPAAIIESWQGTPILVANLTPDGRLMGMEIRARPAPSATPAPRAET